MPRYKSRWAFKDRSGYLYNALQAGYSWSVQALDYELLPIFRA
jgi:hypothetical protein